ncbi:MAG: putative ABC exporter domain-containing protein [Armatimonadota bacterium]|nr:putative ABC exporter domain-containing protein [bacterium]
MRPLLYLELRQIVNSIKNSTRSPKRLIPLVLMVVYVVSMLIQGLVVFSGAGRSRHPDFGLLQAIPAENLEPILFIMLSVGCMIVIYSAFSSGTLIFSLAHIDFLFPTPISRRHVLLMQLLRDYIKYGFYVTFGFLVVGSSLYGALGVKMMPWGLASIAGLTALFVTVVNISHTINIIFTFGFERLKQAGIVIKALLFIGPISAFVYGVYQYIATGSSYASVLWAANSPVINFVFAPARWCAVLLLAPLSGLTIEDWICLAFLWVFAGASFVLLMSRKENIYEPSLGISVTAARRRQAMRLGDFAGLRMDILRSKGTKRASGLGIPPFGRGASALIWKSLLLRYRVSKGQLGIMLIAPIVIAVIIRHSFTETATSMLTYIPAALLYVVWILSMMAPTEMRLELKQANIVKSMPIAAWKIMLAQTMNSVIYLTAGVLMFSGAMWTIIPETRGPVLVACTLSAPFLGFANVSMTAIAGILYPDTRDPVPNFISGILSFILVSIAALPTIVLGTVCIYVLRTSYLTAAIVASICNIAMGAFGVTISGLIFRRFDPTY